MNQSDRTARVIRALLGMSGLHEKDLAAHLGWQAPTMSKAMKGKRQWRASEIEDVADFLHVPVSVMFESPDDLMDRLRIGSSLTHEVPGQGDLPFALGA